jgi:biopolymer transport protein ExbD
MAFGGFGRQAAYQPMSEINTTPLVDVMLVLLIIFMVTVPLLTHAVPVELPKAGAKAEQARLDAVTLSVDAQGHYYWNDAPVSREGLAKLLAQAAKQEPQADMRLRADKDTRYDAVAQVVSAAQEAGIRTLGFVTEVAH